MTEVTDKMVDAARSVLLEMFSAPDGLVNSIVRDMLGAALAAREQVNMDDVVANLRDWSDCLNIPIPAKKDFHAAADTIEELVEALQSLLAIGDAIDDAQSVIVSDRYERQHARAILTSIGVKL